MGGPLGATADPNATGIGNQVLRSPSPRLAGGHRSCRTHSTMCRSLVASPVERIRNAPVTAPFVPIFTQATAATSSMSGVIGGTPCEEPPAPAVTANAAPIATRTFIAALRIALGPTSASPRCHPALNLMDDASLGVSACQGRARPSPLRGGVGVGVEAVTPPPWPLSRRADTPLPTLSPQGGEGSWQTGRHEI
jgi:hypothetical protein